MTTQCFAIRKIAQVDNYTFSIEWNDGKIMNYRLSDVQRLCPCAYCRECPEERTAQVDPSVKAKRIVSVGRYALKITFTKGCSHGIYSFDLLRGCLQSST